MNQSRIKTIRKTARLAILAVPDLSFEDKQKLYNNTIRSMKNASKTNYMKSNIPKENNQYKKKHPNESLVDFRNRRKACNARRRMREKAGKYAQCS